MEREGTLIPFEQFKLHQSTREADRLQGIAAVRADALKLLSQARADFDKIGEDSYASRIEGRERVNFLTWFNSKVAKADAKRVVDLRRTITDYGYDPEAAATDQSCGLEYVSEADRKETDYHINIGSVSGLIQRLEQAGVKVATGVRRVRPDYEDEDEG
jgi:hypothetical protein